MHRYSFLSVLFGLAALLPPVAMADEWQWQVTESPPPLSDPSVIDVAGMRPSHSAGWKLILGPINDQTTVHCDGWIYKVLIDEDEDAIVHMTGEEPLTYPVHVSGGRNVRIVGLHFELMTQPGCDIGELPNRPVKKHPNANIHPRIPGAIALRVQQAETSFIEGLHIDVRGHQADCIVGRNPDEMTDAEAKSQRDVVIQNTWCSGVEGMGKTDIGDGIHGDLFQNQGGDILRRLVLENVSMRTSQEGVVLHGSGSSRGTVSMKIRRYDYAADSRYVGDDDYERFGLAFTGWPGKDWTLEDIYIDDPRGLDYLKFGNTRYGNSPRGNGRGKIRKHDEVYSGSPDDGPFAPPDRTGIHYVTPHAPVAAP